MSVSIDRFVLFAVKVSGENCPLNGKEKTGVALAKSEEGDGLLGVKRKQRGWRQAPW